MDFNKILEEKKNMIGKSGYALIASKKQNFSEDEEILWDPDDYCYAVVPRTLKNVFLSEYNSVKYEVQEDDRYCYFFSLNEKDALEHLLELVTRHYKKYEWFPESDEYCKLIEKRMGIVHPLTLTLEVSDMKKILNGDKETILYFKKLIENMENTN